MSKNENTLRISDAHANFLELVEEGRFAAAKRLRRYVADSLDIFPRGACDMLDIPQGSTYSDAAAAL